MTKFARLSQIELDRIRGLLEHATGDSWHWAGNIDVQEPYLAAWVPGQGRTIVMAVGGEERTADSPGAAAVRAYAAESDQDPEELVEDWLTDRFGNPVTDPRLSFGDRKTLHVVHARERVVFEVAPHAAVRDHPDVYRADITDINHPDAQIISGAREWLEKLVAEVTAARAALDLIRDAAEGPDFPRDEDRLAAIRDALQDS